MRSQIPRSYFRVAIPLPKRDQLVARFELKEAAWLSEAHRVALTNCVGISSRAWPIARPLQPTMTGVEAARRPSAALRAQLEAMIHELERKIDGRRLDE